MLSAGARLGPYEIVAPLGAGGMGEVWKARDTRLDRLVAVKVLPAHLAEHPEALARFEREAKAVAALNHPNILALHDLGRESGTVYAVMELLEGETLRARLASGPLPARKAVELTVQMAEGLAAAHDKGIVHRDLKPENLWVTKEGRLKILDFGLAKVGAAVSGADGPEAETRGMSGEVRTEQGTILGTLGYMSPEQVRGEAVDARADIFSFGVVLYEMLTGRRAFARGSSADTLAAILKEDPPELAGSGRKVPPELERTVMHCLEKNPVERFQSAHDVAFSLQAVSDLSAEAATPPAAKTAKKRLAYQAAAALFALAIAAMSFVAGRHSAPVAQPATFKKLTFRQQSIFNARFAPDGRTIFFSAAQSGNEPELFSISPESPDPRPMGLQRTALLSVSSKGELALLTGAHWVNHKFFIGTLARMPPGGGGPRELAEGIREADWSPDGAGLAIIREVAGMDRLEYPLGTVLAQTAGYFSDPRFSADGQRIALFEHPFRWDDRGSVILVDLQGRKTVVSQGWASEEGLAWSADGREILFSAGAGVSDLSILAVPPGGAVRKVLESSSSLFLRDVSRDGKWLATGEEARVSLFALAPGETSERDLSWLDWSFGWALSADGRWLLFSEESPLLGPFYSACLRRTDGSPPVRLGDGDAGGLSPDGKLALGLVPTSPMQLMLYPTGPGEARRLDTGPITEYSNAYWFPDGARILISGSEPGKAPRCYELPIAGGPPRAVTREGSANGLVSPDGRFVCVEKASGEATMIVPLAGGEPRMLSYLSAGERVARWTPDGRSLLVFSRKQVPSPLDRVDVSTGRRETLRRLAPADPTGVVSVICVAVADDPASYAYSCYRERSKLVLIEGAR